MGAGTCKPHSLVFIFVASLAFWWISLQGYWEDFPAFSCTVPPHTQPLHRALNPVYLYFSISWWLTLLFDMEELGEEKGPLHTRLWLLWNTPSGPPSKFAPAPQPEAGAHKEAANIHFMSQLPASPADAWQSLPWEKKLNVPPKAWLLLHHSDYCLRFQLKNTNVFCFYSSLLFSAGSGTLWPSRAIHDIIFSYWPLLHCNCLTSYCHLLPSSCFTTWLFISLPLCLPGHWDSLHFLPPPCQCFQWKWFFVSTSANM